MHAPRRPVAIAVILIFLLGGAAGATGGALLGISQQQQRDGQPSAARLEAARELMQVTDSANVARQMMDHELKKMEAAGVPVPPGFFDAFRQEVDLDRLEEVLAEVYARHLTEEQMKAASEFFRTEHGRAFISKQAQIAIESSAAGERLGEQWGQQALEKLENR